MHQLCTCCVHAAYLLPRSCQHTIVLAASSMLVELVDLVVVVVMECGCAGHTAHWRP